MYWLRTFGGLAIERNGVVLDQIGANRKALALLAVLATRGSMGRDQLAALLWPESDVDRAKGSLNQAVHLLRRQLDASDLLLGTIELRLNPECIESDVNLFRRTIEEGDPVTAVRYYGGAFLDGVHIQGTPDFEGWIESHRAELERRYMDALEQLAREAEARGDYTTAVGWWRRLQAIDPLNSRVTISLMLALEASGNRAAALEHARVQETILREEWGITPDPAINAIVDRLRSPVTPSASGSEPVSDTVPERHEKISEPSARNQHSISESPKRSLMRKPVPVVFILLLGFAGFVVALIGTRGRFNSGLPEDDDPFHPLRVVPVTQVPEAGSIAVLPFVDLSAEGDQEYFSDGITEELITLLSKVKGLKVAARTSVFQFKGKGMDIQLVRDKLKVAYLLEGSVRKAGDRLRITTQLINSENGYHLWSEIYERRLSDVFVVQEEISRAIAEALQVKLNANAPLNTLPSGSAEAYEQYLKGLYFLNRLQITQAIEHLVEATRLDPQFARAYAALAVAYAVPAANSDLSPVDARDRGIAAAETSLHIDPLLADAHIARGWLEMIGFRWDEAERSLRRALEIDPRSPRARFYYALYLHRQGQLENAFAELQQARELDPLSLAINAIYGSFLGDLGHIDQAIAHLEATLELDPSFPIAYAVLGHVYLGIGQTGEAIRHYERVAEIVPTSFYKGFLGHAYARGGRISDARQVLTELEMRTDRGEHVSPGAVGWILLGLNEREEGFRRLEQAVDQRDVFLSIYGILTNKHLSETFRDDVRFQRLRMRVSLAP